MILKVGLPSDRKTICFCTPERPDDRSFAVFRASSQLVPPFGHALTAVPIAPGEVVNCEVVRALSLNVTTAICTCCSAGRAAFAAVRSLLAKAVAAFFFAFVSRLLFFILPDLSSTSTISAGTAVVTVDDELSPDAVKCNAY